MTSEAGRQAPTPPTDATRLLALDALRGVMALLVAVYHFQVWTRVFKAGTSLSGAVIALGVHSVQGFFIISGFCFFHLYQGQAFDLERARGFYTKRFFRIAPLYYGVLLLNLLLRQEVGPFTWGRLLENVTLTFGLFHPNHAMVLGGWSIGVEYVFYFAFPMLLLLTRQAVMLYVLLLALSLAAVHSSFVSLPGAPQTARFNTYVQVFNHAFLFILGGAFADLRRRLSLRLSTASLCAASLAVLAVLFQWLPVFYDHFFVMMEGGRVACLAAVALLVLASGFYRTGQSRALTPLVWLGDVSYAVYLLHPFAWLLVKGWLDTTGHPAAAFAIGLLLTLVLAALAHYSLERPFLRFGRALVNREPRMPVLQVPARELPR